VSAAIVAEIRKAAGQEGEEEDLIDGKDAAEGVKVEADEAKVLIREGAQEGAS